MTNGRMQIHPDITPLNDKVNNHGRRILGKTQAISPVPLSLPLSKERSLVLRFISPYRKHRVDHGGCGFLHETPEYLL